MDINLREVTSSAVLEEKKKLRREFKYLDMIFYTVAALIELVQQALAAVGPTTSSLSLLICCTLFCYPAALYGRLVFPGCILQAFNEQVGGQTEDGGHEQRLRLHFENLR